MKHALLILCHKSFDQLINLLQLFDEDFIPYIHFDKKMELPADYVSIVKRASPFAKIYRKYDVKWGSISIVKAQLFLMTEAVKHGGFGYIHLLSAQDMPIRPISYIKDHFEKNDGTEYVSYFQLPNPAWNDSTLARLTEFYCFDFFDYNTESGKVWIDKIHSIKRHFNPQRSIPPHFKKLYGGSNWISITQSCASYICDFHNHNKKFYNRLKYTLAPDEVYFNTIILNSKFAKNVENCNLRFMVWVKETTSPKNLSIKHFYDICTSNALFARKFDAVFSAPLIRNIKKYILNDAPLSIGATGTWGNTYFRGHVFDSGLADAIYDLIKNTSIRSIGDFGCGPGWYVAYLRRRGFDIEGYDGNPNVEELSSKFFGDGFYCQHVDLTEEVAASEPFDMVISLEVGEHIPVKYEEIFIQNMVRNSSKYILLSWAIENQPGDGHVNCRSNDYIISKLSTYGFIHIEPISEYLRVRSNQWWFQNTLMFFQSKS